MGLVSNNFKIGRCLKQFQDWVLFKTISRLGLVSNNFKIGRCLKQFQDWVLFKTISRLGLVSNNFKIGPCLKQFQDWVLFKIILKSFFVLLQMAMSKDFYNKVCDARTRTIECYKSGKVTLEYITSTRR